MLELSFLITTFPEDTVIPLREESDFVALLKAFEIRMRLFFIKHFISKLMQLAIEKQKLAM